VFRYSSRYVVGTSLSDGGMSSDHRPVFADISFSFRISAFLARPRRVLGLRKIALVYANMDSIIVIKPN